ncbi:hypothetical protein TWF730_007115 [Orbilia blumenaviensis]|uniref:Uncharacterized protein n=1 Tax=Orbilia blumenaviensis TaxID=1796055 RepID=A0AAV9VMI7_9PEZI
MPQAATCTASDEGSPMSRKARRKLAKATKRPLDVDSSGGAPCSPPKMRKHVEADGLTYNRELISFDIYVDWRELLASFLDIYDGMGLERSSTDGRSSPASDSS